MKTTMRVFVLAGVAWLSVLGYINGLSSLASAFARTEPLASAPVEKHGTISVTAAAATPVTLAGFTHVVALCVNDSTTNVFVVDAGAANTDAGRGPYCSTCNQGTAFAVGNASLRSSASTATVRCGFYDRVPEGFSLAALAAGLPPGTAAATYLPLAGGTLTGTLVVSGVTNDVTTPAGQDMRLAPGDDFEVQAASGIINFVDSAGTVRALMQTSTSGTSRIALLSGNAAGGGLFVNSSTAALGRQGNVGATGVAACMADQVSASGATCLLSAAGEGLMLENTVQSVTCPDNGAGTPSAANIDPQSSNIQLTNADPHGCVWTMQETTAATHNVAGLYWTATIISDASATPGTDVNTFPDVANVWDGPTLCTTTGLNLRGTLRGYYNNASNKQWVATTCVAN